MVDISLNQRDLGAFMLRNVGPLNEAEVEWELRELKRELDERLPGTLVSEIERKKEALSEKRAELLGVKQGRQQREWGSFSV